jgi:hypothetical protein
MASSVAEIAGRMAVDLITDVGSLETAETFALIT